MNPMNRLQEELSARLSATKSIKSLIDSLVDAGSFVEKDAFLCGKDTLTGLRTYGEGVVTGTAVVQDHPVVIIAQNAEVLSGAFGEGQARRIEQAIEFAGKHHVPVLSILDSAGARVGEGVDMLEGYARVLSAVAHLSSFHVVVVKGQAVGLMAAYAGLADIRLITKDGILSIGAPAVVSAQADCKVADIAGANSAVSASIADIVVRTDGELKVRVNDIFEWLFADVAKDDDPNREAPELENDRKADTLLTALCDNGKWIEYQEQCKGVRCALSTVNDRRVAIIVSDENHPILTASAVEKLIAFTKCAERADAALITLLNNEGIADSDQARLYKAVSFLSGALSFADMHMLGVAVGSCIGNVYALLLSKGIGFDYTLAMADAKVGVLAPTSAIHLVYADTLQKEGNTEVVRQKLAELYTEEHCSPYHTAESGAIDEVIHPATLRPYIANALNLLV